MPKTIFISCFEPSGDAIGAYLVRALRQQFGADTRFIGIAGAEMRAAGVDAWQGIEELNVMGIVPVLKAAPKLLRLIKNLAAQIDALAPDCIVTIDAPDFHIRLLEKMRTHRCPRAQLVSPSVWAWRPKRVHRFARAFDVMYCIFPFEPECYAQTPLRAVYVGHPSVKMALEDKLEETAFRTAFPGQNVVLLPGSRPGELKRLKTDFLEVEKRLNSSEITWLIPTLEQHLEQLQGWFHSMDNVHVITNPDWRFAALRYGDAALCCMGTVELELSLRSCPHLALYRFKSADNLLRRLFRFSIRHGSLSNIIAGREVIPEYLHHGIDHDQIAGQIQQLLDCSSTLHQQQKAAMKDIQSKLASPGENFAVSVSADIERMLKKH